MLGNSMKNTHNLLSNTNLVCVCAYKLYSIYFVSVWWFDIWQAFNCVLRSVSVRSFFCSISFALFLYVFFFLRCYTTYTTTLCSCTIVQFSYQANQPICRNATTFEWANFKCGTLDDCYFQDILHIINVHRVRRELSNIWLCECDS